jgi:hypothetical protein
MMERTGAYAVWVGRPLGRPRRSWENNIKMALGSGMNWIDLVLDRDRWQTLLNAVMNLRVP